MCTSGQTQVVSESKVVALSEQVILEIAYVCADFIILG